MDVKSAAEISAQPSQHFVDLAQVWGWTGPTRLEGATPYVQIFQQEYSSDQVVAIRNENGGISTIMIPVGARLEMARALMGSKTASTMMSIDEKVAYAQAVLSGTDYSVVMESDGK